MDKNRRFICSVQARMESYRIDRILLSFFFLWNSFLFAGRIHMKWNELSMFQHENNDIEIILIGSHVQKQ